MKVSSVAGVAPIDVTRNVGSRGSGNLGARAAFFSDRVDLFAGPR
jgi:hypothetical protein